MNLRRFTLPLVAAALTLSAAANAQTVVKTDPANFKAALAANKGKVVVVNFWATWCGPCVAEFPSLVKLYKANKAKGLELVTLSADDPSDSAKVKAFLAKNGLAKGWLSSTDDVAGYLAYLEPTLSPSADLAIPRTYIIDRNGKVVKALLGGQEYADFQKAVTPLLAKK